MLGRIMPLFFQPRGVQRKPIPTLYLNDEKLNNLRPRSEQRASTNLQESIIALKDAWILKQIPHHYSNTDSLVVVMDKPYYFEETKLFHNGYNDTAKGYFEAKILGNSHFSGLIKVKDDGDCAYRSFLVGLLHALKSNHDPMFAQFLIKLFGQHSTIFPEAMDVFKVLVRDVPNMEFSEIVSLLNDASVSRSLIYVLRQMAAIGVDNIPEEKKIYYVESDEDRKEMEKMGSFAKSSDLKGLADTFKVNLVSYCMELNLEQQFGPANDPTISMLFANDPTISMLFGFKHYDLIV